MQKKFCSLYVENYFGNSTLTNTEVAIQSGYSPDSAYQRAYELLNPKLCPHVVKYIGELREEFRKKSLISDVVTGGIFGLGSYGYISAIMAMHKILENENK